MDPINRSRRRLMAAALALGATHAFAGVARASRTRWHEDRARFAEGVASGDPDADSVILWTRRTPQAGESRAQLTLEVALDADFSHVIVSRSTSVEARADWTCRVLVGGLQPSRWYWYRFSDASGAGSRVGRTRTAPARHDPRAVAFAFVSCQNINLGPLTAWRRMLFDDARADVAQPLEFVLHLGDFIYDTVWAPADRPQGYFDRTVRDIVSFPHGEKIEDFHIPVTVQDYRALYRAYLHDADLQDARARWPFVAIWDNGEYSDKGWQGMQRFGGVTRPTQTRKVAANQAWYEYLPARVRTADNSLAAFAAPSVIDHAVTEFDAAGLGQEANNLAAIGSLTGYRALHWGTHVELILTDQRSYRCDDYTAAPEARALDSKTFPQLVPFESLQMIDAGRTWADGRPNAKLQFADAESVNFCRDRAPRTLLGATQKSWFLERLAQSQATWKIWANTVATLDMRADPQHLPEGLTSAWPGAGYAGFARTDHSTAYTERAQIYDFVARERIAGFVTVSGDRHSFWAGRAAAALPPEKFAPVGVSFVTGSISSPGFVEAFEHILPNPHPLRSLYLIDRPGADHPEAAVNLLLRHGVRSCLDYAAHADLAQAKALADPGNAPHVDFVDMGGHGYSIVRAAAARLEVEFVCVPRPVENTTAADGGPIRYRVVHRTEHWAAGATPVLAMTLLQGDTQLSG